MPTPVPQPASGTTPLAGDAPVDPQSRHPGPSGRLYGVVFIAMLIACALLHPIGPGLALAMGGLLALTLGSPHHAMTSRWSRQLLALSVTGLGFGLSLSSVLRTAAHALPLTLATILATLALGALLARLLKADRTTSTLIAGGTAICGGSAIAALAPAIRAQPHQTGVALATVFTLNAIALFVFPPIGRAMGLTDAQFGVWAALAIHDTSSVVGACSAYSAGALAIGTTVKLARALWIAPMALAFSALSRGSGSESAAGADAKTGTRFRVRIPWFIAGFLLAALVRYLLPDAAIAWDFLADWARRLLVVTVFLIGCGLSREVLRRVGPRPLVLAVTLWIIVSAASLALVRAGLIAMG